MHLLFDIILASLTLISPCYSCFLAGMAVVGLARERLWPLYRMGRKVTWAGPGSAPLIRSQSVSGTTNPANHRSETPPSYAPWMTEKWLIFFSKSLLWTVSSIKTALTRQFNLENPHTLSRSLATSGCHLSFISCDKKIHQNFSNEIISSVFM